MYAEINFVNVSSVHELGRRFRIYSQVARIVLMHDFEDTVRLKFSKAVLRSTRVAIRVINTVFDFAAS
jgi:hypothetical protein